MALSSKRALNLLNPLMVPNKLMEVNKLMVRSPLSVVNVRLALTPIWCGPF